LAPYGPLSERLQSLGVKTYFSKNIFQLNRKQNRLWLLQIIKNLILGFIEFFMVILKERPDIVHANGLGATIYSTLPAKFFKKPFIWTDHDVFEPGSIESNLAKKISSLSNCTITVSHFVEESLKKVGVPGKKIITIYNGLDYKKFNPAKVKEGFISKELKLDKNQKIIAMFAMISRWKGHHIVIEAAKELVGRGRGDIIIIFVGETVDKGYRGELEERIKKYSLQSYIHFLGFVEDVVKAYKDVTIFLNASVKPEPLGTTIYEAMAMERLVIASDIGGNPEIIEDGKTGFLVPPASAKRLADKVEYVLDNFDKLEEIRKNARKAVMDKFDLAKMVKNYNKVYDDIQNFGRN
jgi:glycosyltransferase involved in cell wall biosynthesis